MQERLVREATRVVGLYRDGAQVGFCRALGDGVAFMYLADVYVLPEHRGRGLGVELVREMVEHGPYAGVRWMLHTADAHELYASSASASPGRGRWSARRPAEPAFLDGERIANCCKTHVVMIGETASGTLDASRSPE